MAPALASRLREAFARGAGAGLLHLGDRVLRDPLEDGTPLGIVLRDCGVRAFAIVGAAMEIGIEPTVRHGSDLGLVPIVIEDACAGGHAEAAERALANIRYLGDAFVTDVDGFAAALGTRIV